jgi:hypothetical protein
MDPHQELLTVPYIAFDDSDVVFVVLVIQEGYDAEVAIFGWEVGDRGYGHADLLQAALAIGEIRAGAERRSVLGYDLVYARSAHLVSSPPELALGGPPARTAAA